MNKLKSRLQELVDSGKLESFSIQNVDENGNIGKTSKHRNAERMTLIFSDGESLVVDTFCSGCSENTTFHVE